MFSKEIFRSELLQTLDQKRAAAKELELRLNAWGVSAEEATKRRIHEELHSLADPKSGVFVVERTKIGPFLVGPYVPAYIAIGYRTDSENFSISTAVGLENMSDSDWRTAR